MDLMVPGGIEYPQVRLKSLVVLPHLVFVVLEHVADVHEKRQQDPH
jgi:hypothetical protein